MGKIKRKYYRTHGVPVEMMKELEHAAVECGLTRTSAFERLLSSGDIEAMIQAGMGVDDYGGRTLTFMMRPEAKEALDAAIAATGVKSHAAGRLILAARAGRIVEALRESAA